MVKPTFYSVTLLISGLVRQPQCHISSGSSGGQKARKAVSNPLILPCSQGSTAGCAHKPPRRADNPFPESFLSKDTLSRDIWSVTRHPRHGLAVGCRSTPAVLFHMGCMSPPSHDHAQASVSRECKRQGRGWVYGSQVPSWLCFLACRESLQPLQSSGCRSQFTPPAAPNEPLQKQTGGSNALSGECSHLRKKEPFSPGYPNINTWRPLRAPSDPAVSVPCQKKCCSFPFAPHKALQPVSVLQIMAWA